MRRALTILGVTVVLGIGVTAAVALGAGGTSKHSSGSTSSTTKSPVNVWLCHHTGSWKHPYHLIHVSTHALPAHMRHDDLPPGADDSCPTSQPAGAKTHGQGNGQSKNAETKDEKPSKGDDETETNDD
jgi:hypothetical protein